MRCAVNHLVRACEPEARKILVGLVTFALTSLTGLINFFDQNFFSDFFLKFCERFPCSSSLCLEYYKAVHLASHWVLCTDCFEQITSLSVFVKKVWARKILAGLISFSVTSPTGARNIFSLSYTLECMNNLYKPTECNRPLRKTKQFWPLTSSCWPHAPPKFVKTDTKTAILTWEETPSGSLSSFTVRRPFFLCVQHIAINRSPDGSVSRQHPFFSTLACKEKHSRTNIQL